MANIFILKLVFIFSFTISISSFTINDAYNKFAFQLYHKLSKPGKLASSLTGLFSLFIFYKF